MSEETIVWKGKPSNWTNFPVFIFCMILAAAIVVAAIYFEQPLVYAGLAIPVLILLARVLIVKSTSYRLTDQRFFLDEGIFTRISEELELYRVKDITIVRPFFLRLVGRGTIILHTSDKTHPKLYLRAVKNIDHVRDQIRTLVEKWREKKGVREIDRAGDDGTDVF